MKRICLAAVLMLAVSPVAARVKPPAVLGSNMVLQRNTEVNFWGGATPNSRVRVYASIGLSYYPFREENVRAMRDSVRAALPAEYRKARIEIYTDRREVGELIPMAASVAAGSGSTSTVPKSLGSTTRVWVSVSPFTVTFTACPPEDAL